MIFALSLIPMVLAAGAGIDFFRVMIVRTEMSSALDAAALAVGGSSSLTTDEMAALAKKFFDANYRLDSSYGEVSDLSVTVSDKQIVITASNDVPTFFIKLAGLDTLHVATSTTVVWGQVKLWVALALDNTGSMAGDKLTALKSASKELLAMLKDAASTDGDVRVAIIPFNKNVNLGTSYYNSTWLDWTSWDAANGYYVSSTTQTCTYGGGGHSGGGGGHSGGGGGYYCYYTTTKTWTANSHSTWNGCVTDRGKSSGPYNDYDVLTTVPTSSDTYSYFVPEPDSTVACPQKLMPLSYDWTALNSEIDAMTANGATNQTIGLVWGWHAMTDGLPLSPPTLPDDTNRVIILLSDGQNTQDRWYGNGSSQSTQVDARMAEVCTNAKADGITIYTVLVMSGVSSVLKACASDESKYFQLTAANQITTAFVTIGQQITNLRVAK